MNPDRAILPIARILGIGGVLEFLGHGALGIGRVAAWTSYFAVVGIGASKASALMPLVGFFDVALAAALLVLPSRACILYMTAWGLWTALLRPLAGETPWEAVERAGNYGALAAFFLLTSGGQGWFRLGLRETLTPERRRAVAWILRLTTVLLLAGHGALGLLGKPLLASHYASVGIHSEGFETAVGAFECLLAAAVLVRPARGLLLSVVLWKLLTEFLSPVAGLPLWVFVEHAGSYAAPLALALLPLQGAAEVEHAPADAARASA
jgi:hypothetical protein